MSNAYNDNLINSFSQDLTINIVTIVYTLNLQKERLITTNFKLQNLFMLTTLFKNCFLFFALVNLLLTIFWQHPKKN